MKFFLSHSSVDANQVAWVTEQVKALGFDTYVAEHDPQPGMLLADKVLREIENCDAFIVILSKNGLNAPFVREEIGVALHAMKIPIALVEPGTPANTLAMLQGLEYISFDPDDPEGTREKLVRGVQRVAQKLRAQADLVAKTEQERIAHEQKARMLLLAIAAILLFILVAFE